MKLHEAQYTKTLAHKLLADLNKDDFDLTLDNIAWYAAWQSALSYSDARTKDIAHLMYYGTPKLEKNLEEINNVLEGVMEESENLKDAFNELVTNAKEFFS